jgi:hypothetical protein
VQNISVPAIHGVFYIMKSMLNQAMLNQGEFPKYFRPG